MVEDEVVKLFRQCDPERQNTVMHILDAFAFVSELDREARRKASQTARVFDFKKKLAEKTRQAKER
jgi:mannose/cellobiose epimerase-like protein (N-acyl-D-glucosamine 2-epimerase family)